MRIKITGIGTSDGHFPKRNDYIGMIGEFVLERIHPDGYSRGKFEEEGTGNCLFFSKIMYEKEKYKPKKEGAMKKMRRVKDLFMNTTKMKPTTKITNSRSNLPRL